MAGIHRVLVFKLAGVALAFSGFEAKLQLAKKKGLSGYDLIDALDVWFGIASPDYSGPHNQLDFLGNRDGRVTVEDWKAAGLPVDHFHYFDRNANGIMDIHEAHSWHQQRQPAKTMNLSEVHSPPKGHMQRLGSWKPPLSSEGLEYHKPYPHPRDFWRKHMDGYLPANLKGAQHGWPAMNWTKEVLREKFGWVDAKLEPKATLQLLAFDWSVLPLSLSAVGDCISVFGSVFLRGSSFPRTAIVICACQIVVP